MALYQTYTYAILTLLATIAAMAIFGFYVLIKRVKRVESTVDLAVQEMGRLRQSCKGKSK